MVRVYKNRCRCATSSDFFQDLAVRHLRKTMSAEFHRRGHAENAETSEPIDHFPWNVGLAIYFDGIESRIEKLPKFRQRLIELCLLRRGHARIRHHPVGDDAAEKKAL